MIDKIGKIRGRKKMSLRYGILGLLNYGPQTGYEINTFFQNSLSFFWKAQTSQIYRELNKLEQEGLANSELIVQYDKPNKKLYHISEMGKNAFDQWLADEDINSANVRNTFLMRIFFSGFQDKEKTIRILENYIKEMERELKKMDGVEESIQESPVEDSHKNRWEMTVDFGYMYGEMCIAWAKREIQRIKHTG